MKRFDDQKMQDWGIAVLRMVVGGVLMAHGMQKLVSYGIAGTAGFFAQAGIPVPLVAAALSIGAESLGGLALVLGLGTRWAAGVLTINMAVAVLAVHLKHGFFLPTGFEYAFTLLAANVSLVLTGPGAFALDRVIGRERSGREGFRRSPLVA